ncbi:MAG: exo-alpha-sialidase [Bacteroidales bacterium]|nr:exo-alpha-sialidase [Bacteroidales bacterium]
MKNVISKYLLFVVTGFMIISCSKTDDYVRVSLHQMQVPVLKFKQNNLVLQIRIIAPGDALTHNVTSVSVTTEGTDDLSDIKTVRLFYLGKDSLWTRYEDGENVGSILDPLYFAEGSNPVQFGTDKMPSGSITFEDRQVLEPGSNFFWLTYELADDANLHHRVDAGCTKVAISGNTHLKPGIVNPPLTQRIGVAVRQRLDDLLNTYRVPGIATTNKGTLLAIYDARRDSSRDLQGDMDIGLSRSTDGGNTWEPMRIAIDMGEWGGLPQKFNGVSDASILVDKNSENIFVAGLWMHGLLDKTGRWIEDLAEESDAWEHQWRRKGSQPGFGVKQTSQFMVSKSVDDGKTWGKPVNLTRMCKKQEWWLWAPAPGRGITLEDNTLVFPTQGRNAEGKAFSNITWSKDGGQTWKISNPGFSGTNECAVVQLNDGSVMLNMRYRQPEKVKGTRAVAVTHDLGETWEEHPTSRIALQEPVCMGSLHKHVYTEGGEKKSILLFSNPNVWRNPRRKTIIKVSFDDGMTWPEQYWLLLDEGFNRGYSCLTSIDENTIGVFYEGSQADMTFESIPLNELLNK